jgi:hypothetical protein
METDILLQHRRKEQLNQRVTNNRSRCLTKFSIFYSIKISWNMAILDEKTSRSKSVSVFFFCLLIEKEDFCFDMFLFSAMIAATLYLTFDGKTRK